jgi:hypothetical protein
MRVTAIEFIQRLALLAATYAAAIEQARKVGHEVCAEETVNALIRDTRVLLDTWENR